MHRPECRVSEAGKPVPDPELDFSHKARILADKWKTMAKRMMLLLVILFCLCRVSAAAETSVQSFIQSGDQILSTVTEENAQKAIAEYEKALAAEPGNYDANWKIARAYCLILDFKTHALIEEKDEYKPFLRELGGKAEAHGAKAYAANPKGLDALVWYNGSIAYHAASMGIVHAILHGAGTRVKKLAGELIQLDDSYHGAFGYRIMGRFHIKAPFPVGSKKKAAEFLEKAVAKYPADLQNHFWLGEAYLTQKNNRKAAEQFQFVLDHPPSSIETHLAETFKSAAQKRLNAKHSDS